MKIVILSGANAFAKRKQLRSRKPALSEAEGDPYAQLPLHGCCKAFSLECSCQGAAAAKRIPCEARSEVEMQGVLRLRNAAHCARHYSAQDDKRSGFLCILTLAL